MLEHIKQLKKISPTSILIFFEKISLNFFFGCLELIGTRLNKVDEE